MKLVSVIFIYAILVGFISSCTRDSVMEVENECSEEITYDEHIRSIMDRSCAYTGCHLSGGAPGNFATYSGISDYIGGDFLERRVVIQRDMPPNNATSGPTELNDDEIDLFKCWIEGGYLEN